MAYFYHGKKGERSGRNWKKTDKLLVLPRYAKTKDLLRKERRI